MRGFSGFPDGKMAFTSLPNVVFGELLADIESLAELKVTLYALWLLSQKKGYPRYVTRREMQTSETLLLGLRTATPSAVEAIDEGLRLAERRGTLLRLDIEVAEQVEEVYFANTQHGRRAVEQLRAGELDIGQALVNLPPGTSVERASRPDVFSLYEQNIGLITPLIAEELSDAEQLYPLDWIEAAVQQAVAYNRRNWRYVQRILERWAVEGKKDEAVRRGTEREGTSARQPGWGIRRANH